MSKEQIEEMAKELCGNGMPNGNCAMDDEPCNLECVYGCCAEKLYAKGYRKQGKNTIELPCKIGDTIYLPWEWNGQKGIACLTVTVLRCIVGFGWSFGTDFDTDDEDYYEAYNCGSFKLKDFGKIVFLSREEAEKALAKMKEVNNERRKAD